MQVPNTSSSAYPASTAYAPNNPVLSDQSGVSRTTAWVIPYEWLAYAGLIVLALLLRVLALDASPLTVREASPALTALQSVSPYAEFTADQVTDSPIVFQAQRFSFSVLGANEIAARILTALAGTAAAFLPLLLRSELGQGRTLILCLLLALSPVGLMSSRSSAGLIWGLAFAWVAIWAWLRFARTQAPHFAIAGLVASGLLIFTASPGAVMLAIVLDLSALIAWLLTALDRVDETVSFEPGAQLGRFFGRIPWLRGLLILGFLTVAMTTTFLLYPRGLSGVGEVLTGFLQGFTQRPPDAFGSLPLTTALFYEPLLWIFALLGVIVLLRQREFSFMDRLFAIWAVLGIAAAVLYQGGEPADALWITVPLAGLASAVIARLFVPAYDAFGEDPLEYGYEGDDPIPDAANEAFGARWAVPLLAGAGLLLMTMIAMHLQVIGRASVGQAQGFSVIEMITRVVDTASASNLRVSVLWTFISVMFFVIGGLLAASLWGNRKAVRGLTLGILGFMVINGLSSAWGATVSDAGLALEPWHYQAVSPQMQMLRETLIELDQRESLATRELPITIVADPATGVTRDGPVAWAVRDFRNVTFVSSLPEAEGEQVVIAADQGSDISLGGSYVGRPFVAITSWAPATVEGMDAVGWWFQRIARQQPVVMLPVALYVRMDIYESEPFEENAFRG